MVTIRRLRPGEVERLVGNLWVDFYQELAAEDGYDDLDLADGILRDGPPDGEALSEVVAAHRERVERPDAKTFVAAGGGDGIEFALGGDGPSDDPGDADLVGFVAVEYLDPSPIADGPEVTVDELYVRPDRRDERIASALLAAGEAWATHRDCVVVRLAVSPENPPARAVYENRDYGETRAGMVRILR